VILKLAKNTPNMESMLLVERGQRLAAATAIKYENRIPFQKQPSNIEAF
jgi:hypothetical protein